jgi:hypothetical protein
VRAVPDNRGRGPAPTAPVKSNHDLSGDKKEKEKEKKN